jgi:hypothetical protein
MPAKGLSLHLGLNSVDPNQYEGWDGALTACEFDAKDMRAIAQKQGFTPTVLLTPQATAAAVIAAIEAAAKQLSKGDFFLLSYSGHGGQVPDTNHDESRLPTGLKDKYDETWVLFDRQLVDDELYALWARFKPGVRIFVLSDSCHSGTVSRVAPAFIEGGKKGNRYRFMPRSVADKTFRAHRKLYTDIQKNTPSAEKAGVRSTVILISGCQDNQTSLDGERNGLFTEKLRRSWANGKFKGTYKIFRDIISSTMPGSQTPNYFLTGVSNAAFEAQKPFAI